MCSSSHSMFDWYFCLWSPYRRNSFAIYWNDYEIISVFVRIHGGQLVVHYHTMKYHYWHNTRVVIHFEFTSLYRIMFYYIHESKLVQPLHLLRVVDVIFIPYCVLFITSLCIHSNTLSHVFIFVSVFLYFMYFSGFRWFV